MYWLHAPELLEQAIDIAEAQAEMASWVQDQMRDRLVRGEIYDPVTTTRLRHG